MLGSQIWPKGSSVCAFFFLSFFFPQSELNGSFGKARGVCAGCAVFQVSLGF